MLHRGFVEGFAGDIIVAVQTDMGIPLTSGPPCYYVVLCRTSLSLIKPSVTEMRFNLPEVWKSNFSSPAHRQWSFDSEKCNKANRGCFSVCFPQNLQFSQKHFSFLLKTPFLALPQSADRSSITAPHNVSVSTGEHNERLWEKSCQIHLFYNNRV